MNETLKRNLVWAFYNPIKFIMLLTKLYNDNSCFFHVKGFDVYSSTVLDYFDLETYYYKLNPGQA
jgi:hypothetical protein